MLQRNTGNTDLTPCLGAGKSLSVTVGINAVNSGG